MQLKVVILTLLAMVWRFLFVWEHSFASFCAFFTICYTPYICNLIGSLSVHVFLSGENANNRLKNHSVVVMYPEEGM